MGDAISGGLAVSLALLNTMNSGGTEGNAVVTKQASGGQVVLLGVQTPDK